jgi:hypothetical protein
MKIMLIKSIMESDINAYSEHKGKKRQTLYEKYKGDIRQVMAMSAGMELCASSGTSK